MKRTVAASFLLAWLTTCTAHSPLGRKDLLDFLKVGATVKDEVYLHLGSPDATYEKERILAFRVGQDSSGYFHDPGYYVVGNSLERWTGVRYSLILAFDENGVLRRHSLVLVRSP